MCHVCAVASGGAACGCGTHLRTRDSSNAVGISARPASAITHPCCSALSAPSLVSFVHGVASEVRLAFSQHVHVRRADFFCQTEPVPEPNVSPVLLSLLQAAQPPRSALHSVQSAPNWISVTCITAVAASHQAIPRPPGHDSRARATSARRPASPPALPELRKGQVCQPY